MCTRATYSFEHKVLSHSVFYYSQRDGDPTGSADCFERMRQKEVEQFINELGSARPTYRGDLPELFVKANPMEVEFW